MVCQAREEAEAYCESVWRENEEMNGYLKVANVARNYEANMLKGKWEKSFCRGDSTVEGEEKAKYKWYKCQRSIYEENILEM